MKLLHFADIHVGMLNYSRLDPETGLESRLLDFFKVMDQIVDTAIKQQIDALIFAGDAYKTRDPSPTQQRGFADRINRVSKAGIPTVMVVGNHDTPNAEGRANTLDIYETLDIPHVWVSRKPELLNIPTKSGNLQVVTAPWLHKNEFKDLGEKLVSLYEKLKPDEPAILVGHLEVEGASMGSEKGLALVNDVTVPLSLLTDHRLQYVALGHIHKHQNLNPKNNPPVIYAGSPERIDFGEAKEDKGFLIVEVEPNQPTKLEFIQTHARKFTSIYISLKSDDQNPTSTILEDIKKHLIEDSIVKLSIDIPAGLDKEIEMDKIKKALAKANYIAGISRNVERVNRNILDGQTEIERLTPIQALQKFWEAKKYDGQKIKLLEKYAAELLG